MQIDRDARPMLGWIDHDIPEHEAISPSVARPKLAMRSDSTASMFNEDQIKQESEVALAKRDYASRPCRPE